MIRFDDVSFHYGGENGTGDGVDHIDLTIADGAFIAWLRRRKKVFDVVFADPPYHEGWGAALPGIGGLAELLALGGVMVVEHSVRELLTVPPGEWRVESEREYGETVLTFLSPVRAIRDAEAQEGAPQEGEVGE